MLEGEGVSPLDKEMAGTFAYHADCHRFESISRRETDLRLRIDLRNLGSRQAKGEITQG